MTAGTVREIWRYPVKSMAGEGVSRAEVDASGVVGDRRLAVYTADGHIGSGKITRRFRPVPGLRRHGARIVGDRTWIAFPDGIERGADEDGIDEALSASLGQPVALRAEAEVAHKDAAPLHILSTTTLAWIGDKLGRDFDAFPFRPNLIVETDQPWPAEEGWIGQMLAVGAVKLRVIEPTERCVMVNVRPQGEDDSRVLRALVEGNQACLGVYADVLVAGAIACSDAIHMET